MSFWQPGSFSAFGAARPEVLAAARLIQSAGWRVTSIVRPDTALLRGPSHAAGIALDVAPLTGGVGGFGPKTGRLILEGLTKHIPGVKWWVVGENDHFHIQLAPDRSRVGILLKRGVQWFD